MGLSATGTRRAAACGLALAGSLAAALVYLRSGPVDRAAYRRLQQGWLENPAGASVLSTLALLLVLPVLEAYRILAARRIGDFPASLLLWLLPLALLMTLLHGWAPEAACLLALPLLPGILAGRTGVRPGGPRGEATGPAQKNPLQPPADLGWLSVYRSSVMLSTVVAILAVDFVIFPPQHAKTTRFGVSLMDLGVGSFIFSSAVTAGCRAARSSAEAALGASRPAAGPTSARRFLRSVAILLALGGARLAFVDLADYQTSDLEYGAHWNFFFSLALVALASRVVLRFLGGRIGAWFGLALLAGHQVCLSRLGFAEWILDSPRADFLSANREGLVGALAFLGLYLVAFRFGGLLAPVSAAGLRAGPAAGRASPSPVVVTTLSLAVAAGLHCWVQPVSRRLANPAYVAWCFAANALCLLGFRLVHHRFRQCPPADPRGSAGADGLFDAVSRRQLPFFLLANLLTGTINLAVPTLLLSPAWAALLLALYLGVLSCAAAITARPELPPREEPKEA